MFFNQDQFDTYIKWCEGYSNDDLLKEYDSLCKILDIDGIEQFALLDEFDYMKQVLSKECVVRLRGREVV